MQNRSDSPEGLISACMLGIDLSQDRRSALYYLNAMLILCEKNPDSIPCHWMTGLMARTLTKETAVYLGTELRTRVMLCGVREYERVLSLMAPGQGPAMVHHTLANLLDQLDGYDLSIRHRETALNMERTPWTLHGAACTLVALDRVADALPLMKETIAIDPSDWRYPGLLGQIYQSLGQPAEAFAAWNKQFEMTPGSDTLEECAMLYRDMGNYAAAREYTRKVLATDTGNRVIKIWDARFAAILGEPGSAQRIYEAGQLDFQGKPIDFGDPSTDPWFAAVETGDLTKVKQLLPSQDINKREPVLSQTALMCAACYGFDAIADVLIKAGAKLDLVDKNGDAAINYTAEFQNARVTKLLLDAGANPDVRDKWGQSPLIKCATKRHWSSMKLLLEKKANPDIGSNEGNALHFAAGHGDITAIHLLLAHGANVNALNVNRGTTPLIEACRDYAHSFVIPPLLQVGADVNARDKDDRTALHYATNPLLNIPLVELLLEKGADPTLQDKGGVTPIAKARLLGFEDIAKLMEKKAGRAEPFYFPVFSPADPGFTPQMKKACSFVIPILLAQGDPLGWPSGILPTDKKSALHELVWMFDIKNAADLKEEIDALKTFEPRYRDEAASLSPELGDSKINEVLKKAALKIHATVETAGVDENAWVNSHIIYLSDLGVSAGFLDPEEGKSLIASASGELSQRFSSWPDYLKSFMLGAKFHNGWQSDRYQHICQQIITSGLPWP